MMFGTWGNEDHEDSVRIIHRALDAGINFIDTADVYSRGESEEIVGRPLAGGCLTGGYRKGTEPPASRRRDRLADRFDVANPANHPKLEAADALARLAEEAGMSLIEMSLAWVLRHPAVTAAIIGPRTMGHLESQLGAAEVQLSDAVRDRSDATGAPGLHRNPADSGRRNPA